MKQTSITIYQKNNICGNQYAPNNCKPYGTKWRIQYKLDEYGNVIWAGTPKLIDSNWTIDEFKVDLSNEKCYRLGF